MARNSERGGRISVTVEEQYTSTD